jgi:hypothetical protein
MDNRLLLSAVLGVGAAAARIVLESAAAALVT